MMEVELMKVCLIKGCKSNESTSFLFGFPIENPHQLNEWIEQIPFLDLSSVDLKNSFLCENHFDIEQIRIISDKQLLPNAIPSIFPSPDEDAPEPDQLACRFCLKTFDCSKSSIFIDSIIRKHFKILTNSELKIGQNYPNYVCQLCYNETVKSSLLKTKILEAQKRFEPFDGREDSLGEEVRIKQEIDDSDDDFYEDENYENMNLEVTIQEHENDSPRFKTEDMEDPDEEWSPQQLSRVHKERKRRRYSSSDDAKGEGGEDKDKRKSASLKRKYEHAKEKVLCCDCGQYFARANIKKHHLRIHLRAPPQFKCDICEKMFFRKDELKNHMKVHSGPRDKMHSCELCEKKFATKGSLKIHFNIVHLKIGNICCEFCGKSFMNNTNYQNHLRSTHTLERPFRCDEEGCASAYFSKGDLVDHKNRCHSNETAVCPICAKIFTSKVALRNHDKRIHAEHSFVCPFESCDKKFITNSLLLKHQKVHLGQKDHECTLCGMRYYRNTDLKRHILSIHMKVKIACELPGCKSQFARKETYRNHVLSHHKDIGEENLKIVLESIRNMQLPAPELEESPAPHSI